MSKILPKLILNPKVKPEDCRVNPAVDNEKIILLNSLCNVMTLEVDANYGKPFSSPENFLKYFADNHGEYFYSAEPLYYTLGESVVFGAGNGKYYNKYDTATFYVFNDLIFRREGYHQIYKNRQASNIDSFTIYHIDKPQRTFKVICEQLVHNQLTDPHSGIFLNMLPFLDTGSEYTGGLISYEIRSKNMKRFPISPKRVSQVELDFHEIAYEFRNALLNYLKAPTLKQFQRIDALFQHFQKSGYGPLLMAHRIAKKSLSCDALTFCLEEEVNKQFAAFQEFIKDSKSPPPPVVINTAIALLQRLDKSRNHDLLHDILLNLQKNTEALATEKEEKEHSPFYIESKSKGDKYVEETKPVKNLFEKTEDFFSHLKSLKSFSLEYKKIPRLESSSEIELADHLSEQKLHIHPTKIISVLFKYPELATQLTLIPSRGAQFIQRVVKCLFALGKDPENQVLIENLLSCINHKNGAYIEELIQTKQLAGTAPDANLSQEFRAFINDVTTQILQYTPYPLSELETQHLYMKAVAQQAGVEMLSLKNREKPEKLAYTLHKLGFKAALIFFRSPKGFTLFLDHTQQELLKGYLADLNTPYYKKFRQLFSILRSRVLRYNDPKPGLFSSVFGKSINIKPELIALTEQIIHTDLSMEEEFMRFKTRIAVLSKDETDSAKLEILNFLNKTLDSLKGLSQGTILSSELKLPSSSGKPGVSQSFVVNTNFWPKPEEKPKKITVKVDPDQQSIQAFAKFQGIEFKAHAANDPEKRLKKQRTEWLALLDTGYEGAQLSTQRDLLEEQIKYWQQSCGENFTLKTLTDFKELKDYVNYLKAHEERLYQNVLNNIPVEDSRYKKGDEVEMQIDKQFQPSGTFSPK